MDIADELNELATPRSSVVRIETLEVIPVSVPYVRPEVTSFAKFSAASSVVVKITSDTGLVGWGESITFCDAAGIVAAVEAARPFVVGRDPWDKEAIAEDYFRKGGFQFRPMTGNFAFSGVDMALWDLCGKSAGVPIYQMLGGALREEVDYFYYLQWGANERAEQTLQEQCREGVEQGYQVFYIKVGIDVAREEQLLNVVRLRIGMDRKLRIDVNQAWTLPEALEILPRWHRQFQLDFVEAPVPIEPLEIMLDLKRHIAVPLCANEGLWRQTDVLRIIQERAADYLCFNTYWVGSILRFQTLARLAGLHGLPVCKHSHAELGIAAAAGQHLMLAAPLITNGSQHHTRMLADDVLAHPLPIATQPRWGRIEAPGLGVEIDEARVAKYHEAYVQARRLALTH